MSSNKDPLLCRYYSCNNERTTKRNKSLHTLCKFHRERACINQQKLDGKRRQANLARVIQNHQNKEPKYSSSHSEKKNFQVSSRGVVPNIRGGGGLSISQLLNPAVNESASNHQRYHYPILPPLHVFTTNHGGDIVAPLLSERTVAALFKSFEERKYGLLNERQELLRNVAAAEFITRLKYGNNSDPRLNTRLAKFILSCQFRIMSHNNTTTSIE